MPAPSFARLRRRALIGVRATRVRAIVGVATAAAMLALPVSAQAGRLIVTGHDAESHCIQDAPGVGNPASCSFVFTSVNWVRAGAPDPTKPVLILDRAALDFQKSIDLMVAGGAKVPYQVVDPRSPEFASLPLSTNAYSAILIASSKDDPADTTPQDLNELNGTPDTDAINARAGAIAAFFNAGGGIDVMSGGAAARANSKAYYAFLKITRGGAAVTTPFTLTPLGRTIGFQDGLAHPGEMDSINCCITHVSYEAPAPESPLKAAELDKAGRVVTFAAETNDLASIEEPATSAQNVFGGQPGVPTGGGGGTGAGSETTGSTKPVCVPKSALRISLRRPKGVRFSKLVVYVNGKKTRTVSGAYLGTRSKTKAFTLKLSKTRTSKLRMVVTTASGRRLTYQQTFKPC